MAGRKTTPFTEQANALADFARAMAHPARIAIVTMLIDRDGACCGELVEALPLAQPTVSQHLRALEKAGLIIPNPDGPRMCYTLDRSRIRAFCQAFAETLGTSERKPKARKRAACK